MRMFLALNLDRAVRSGMHRALEPLQQRGWPVRWTVPASLHLTLRFLGDVDGSDVQRIEEALRVVAAKHGPQRLEIAGFGAFPSLRRAATLWVGVAPAPGLMALQRDLDVSVSRLGYGREDRPFRPHITVGRLQSGARPMDIERAAGDYEYSSVVDVETMDLMRSHLHPEGSRYEAILRLALGRQVEP
jgi:RNA 2',3'-cyclic 3'-phosphodiesterase